MADTENEPLQHAKYICRTSAFMAIWQSVLWIIYTIYQIVLSTTCPEDLPTIGADNVTVFYTIRIVYLTDSCTSIPSKFDSDMFMDRDVLLILNCVLLALNILWLLTSSLLLMDFKKTELDNQSTVYMSIWGVATICVSAMDIITGVMFGVDYDVLRRISSEIPGLGYLILFGFFIMMTIALKGYVLPLLNLSSAIQVFRCTADVKNYNEKNVQQPFINDRGPINAFEATSEPSYPNWMNEAEPVDNGNQQNPYYRNQGEVNRGYVGPMENSKYQQQHPLASIMKKSVDHNKNKQRNRDPYDIPSPDYSPIQSRKNQNYDRY